MGSRERRRAPRPGGSSSRTAGARSRLRRGVLCRSMKRRAFLRGLGAAGGLAFVPALAGAAPAARGRAVDRLRAANIQIGARLMMRRRRRNALVRRRAGRGARGGGRSTTRRAERGVTMTLAATPVAGQADAIDLVVVGARRARDRRKARRHARASAPGRATTTCCCRASATRATVSSRGAPPIPPLLSERADIGPHVPPIVPDIAAPQRRAGPVVAGRRRRRSGDACARGSRAGARGWASSCSPGRRRRRGAVSLGVAEEDDRKQRERQHPRRRPRRGAGARSRVRLRRRPGAVRAPVRCCARS